MAIAGDVIEIGKMTETGEMMGMIMVEEIIGTDGMIVEIEEMMGTENRQIEPGGEGQTKAKESDKVLPTGIEKSSFLQQVCNFAQAPLELTACQAISL